MAELVDLNVTDASNTTRFPEGQAPSTLNNGARALEGMIARFHKDMNGSVAVAGTDTYTATINADSGAALYDGLLFCGDFANANTGAATINLTPHGGSALGAKAIKKHGDQALVAGDIDAAAKVLMVYDGTNFQMLSQLGNTPSISQLTSHLDVNGQVIGDGTRELLTFTEDGSAVNHLNIENQASGGGPILRSAGDDSNIDLKLESKGTGLIHMSDLVRFTVGADVSSATSLPLVKDGTFVDVTGTTTVTSFASTGVGSMICIQFDGALILTHHSSDLILPGGANITTAAGDIGIFYEYASGDYRCVSYQVAANAPGSGGGFEYVSSATASGSSTIAFTGLSTGYDYQIQITGYYASGSGIWARMRFGVTGPTYRTSGYQAVGAGLTAGASATGNGSTIYCPIFNAAMGDAAGEIAGGVVTIIDPANSGTETSYHGNSWIYNHVPTMHSGVTGGWYDSNEAHTAIQFDQVSGTMTAGKFDLYKRPNA